MKNTLTTPVVEEQVIAFADLSGFHRSICAQLSPEETFTFLSEYYAVVQRALEGSEGRIVKFIGDALLIVFPSTSPHHAIATLHELKTAADGFLSQDRYDSRFRVKVHVGTVAVGNVGSGELERFDVCGLAVNEAALLPNGEWVLSVELTKRIGA